MSYGSISNEEYSFLSNKKIIAHLSTWQIMNNVSYSSFRSIGDSVEQESHVNI